MVDIFIVNTGETVRLPESADAMSFLSGYIPRPILISESGQVLDASRTTAPTGKLFAFDSMGGHLEDPREVEWIDFSDYPSGSWYEDPFPFQDYDDFNGKYRKLPLIDTQLHKNQTIAKQLFARYRLSSDRLQCVCQVAEKRLAAATAVLKAALMYYKDCNFRLKSILERVPKAGIPSKSEKLDFNLFLGVLAKAKSEQYLKLLTMQKHVKSVKVQLVKTGKIIETRSGLLSKSIRKLMNRVVSAHLEETKSCFVAMRDAYTYFRDVLSAVMNPNEVVENRSQKASSLLSYESQFLAWTTDLEKAGSHVKNMETLVIDALKESQQSHQGISQAISAAGYCTKILKVKFELKIGKATARLVELERKMQILELPAQSDLFETCKTEEMRTRKLALERFAEEQKSLSRKIKFEDEQRRKFCTEYGQLIPQNCFPGLTKAYFFPKSVENAQIDSHSSSFQSRKAILEAAFEQKKRKLVEGIKETVAETLALADDLQQQTQLAFALERELRNCAETQDFTELRSAQEQTFQSIRYHMCI